MTSGYTLPITQAEACETASQPGMTAIIATSYCSPKMFALSLLSLLANSSVRSVIVYINGSYEDRACGDIKQDFCFRLIKKFPVCLRVMRVWGHVGHAECVDGAISWCHTKDMLLMHDDTIILNSDWEPFVSQELEKPDVGAIAHQRSVCMDHICTTMWDHRGLPLTVFPHMNACFLAARKSRLIGWRWQGWHVDLPDRSYGYDMGVWLLYQMKSAGLKLVPIDGHVYHVAGLSNPNRATCPPDHPLRVTLRNRIPEIANAEQHTLQKFSPELLAIYDEFRNEELVSC